MEILYLANVPSPYRVAYFNELGKQCELTVIFEKGNSTERDESWKEYSFENFRGIILKGFSVNTDTAVCPGVIGYLQKKKYDHIVVCNVASPTGLLAIAWLKLWRISYSVEGDGGFAGSGKGFKENIKRWAISSAAICFSTSEELDKYYLTYGADKNCICRYPFTSLYKREMLETPLLQEQKSEIKKGLDIQEEKVILSVGAFIPRKGFDLLINAMSVMPHNWGVYLVGGEPTEEYITLKEEMGLVNLHFVSFCKQAELKRYYMAADLFVFPTREDIWGLVINEAMAFALPVVTTNRCVAGLELVKNGFNGMIVEHDNVEALRGGVEKMINAEAEWEKYAANALETAGKYTIENMVEAHLNAWKEKR